MSRYDIPPSLNVAHKEVSPGRKTDPIGFDMDDWRRQIGALFA
jgi:N-acetyl-anhydromuramyl-L-alanine amidase AmpD